MSSNDIWDVLKFCTSTRFLKYEVKVFDKNIFDEICDYESLEELFEIEKPFSNDGMRTEAHERTIRVKRCDGSGFGITLKLGDEFVYVSQ